MEMTPLRKSAKNADSLRALEKLRQGAQLSHIPTFPTVIDT
jgi:hypothetical protein